MSSLDIFFIVGRGRSGTTLLSRILNSHDHLSVAAETLVIKNLYKKYKNTDWNEQEIQRFLEDLFLEKRMEYWRIPKEELNDYLVTYMPYRSFQDVIKRLYVAFKVKNFRETDVQLVGDKNPHYSLSVPMMQMIFPGTRFVFIVRNYKDNIASFKKVSFDVGNTAALAYRWNYYNRQVLKQMKLNPEQFKLVRFEQILEDPENTINGICSFLGIDYDRSMLDFYKEENEESREWHKNIKSPLNTATIGKWTKVLSGREARMCDYLCYGLSRELGYEDPRTEIGLLDMVISIPGSLYGRMVTFLELRLQLLPFGTRIKIINLYRKLVGVK